MNEYVATNDALREQGSTIGVYDFVANVNVFN